MVQPISKDNHITESLVNKVLKVQQLQQLQLDDMQKQLSDIQLKLHPLNGLLDQMRQLNSLPLQIQQLFDMQTQLRRFMTLAGSTTNDSPAPSSYASVTVTPSEPSTPNPGDSNNNSNHNSNNNDNSNASDSDDQDSLQQHQTSLQQSVTPTKSRTTTNSSVGRLIPWPRIHEGNRSLKLARGLISKEIVVNTIRLRLLQHVTIDFGPHGSRGSNTNRSHLVYKHLAEAVDGICSKETQLQHIELYDQLNAATKTRLCKLLEKKVMEDMIRINLAENQWIAQYFVSIYFRNRHRRVMKEQKNTGKAPTTRKRRRVGESRVATAIRSTPLPASLSNTAPVSAPTTTKRPRGLPVVIREEHDDDSDDDDNNNNDDDDPGMDNSQSSDSVSGVNGTPSMDSTLTISLTDPNLNNSK